MMQKLTKAQITALTFIAENPGKVVNLGASHDNARGHLTIHGTTGSNLTRQRLIETYNPENGRSYDEDTDGSDISPWYSGTYRYRLTAAGRKALDAAAPKTSRVVERCGARVMHDGIGFGCIKTGEHTEHVTALDLKWREGEEPRNCTAKGCIACGRFNHAEFGKKLGKKLAKDHGLNFF